MRASGAASAGGRGQAARKPHASELSPSEIAELEREGFKPAPQPERVSITFGVEALKELAAQQAKRTEAQRIQRKYTKIEE